MADNTVLNPGVGGDTIATDDIGGIKHELVKVEFGVDGSATQVSATDPLPVVQTGTPELPTGAATAANQTTLIGHVDGLETLVTATNSALALFTKAEDAAHGSGDSGIPAWAVRRDADTAFGADNDYTPLAVDANGYLKVNIKAGAGSGGTAMTDDAAFTAATTSFTPVGGIVTADSVDAGDGGAFAMLANRQQKVTLYDSSGVEAAVGGGTQYDEDTASADAQKLTMAGVTRADTAASQVGTDGDRSTLIVDASGRLHVNVGNTVTVGSHAVTNAGIFATQVDGAALSALQLIDDAVYAEDVAAQAADKGIAILAVRRDADTSLVGADNDYANLQVNNLGALKVEVFSGETLPVSLASVPSHAVTNAGTFAVQESGAALTALQLIDDVVYTDDTSTHATGTSKGMLMMAAATPTDAAVNANDIGAVAMTVNREMLVQVNTALPTGTNAIGKLTANSGVDIGDVDVLSVVPGTGATNLGKAVDSALGATDTGVAALAVRDDALATLTPADNDYTNLRTNSRGALWVTPDGSIDSTISGSALTALQKIDDPVLVDDAAFTPATSSVAMAGFQADETATDSIDEGDAGAARMTLDRKQIVNVQPHTAGGLSTFMASGSDGSSILVATAQAVKASAGMLYGYYLYNPEAAVTFVHFYNTAAASVTVGTTNPQMTLAIPAGSAANLMSAIGIVFSNAGWSIAATTTAGGNTAPATGVSAVIWYA